MKDLTLVREVESKRDAIAKFIESELGLKIDSCRAAYTEATIRFTINTRKADLKPEETPEARDFELLAPTYGIPKEALGKAFTGGPLKGLKIVGYMRKKRAKPFLLAGGVGGSQQFVYTSDGIVKQIRLGHLPGISVPGDA